jgi:hypothetical protein
VQGALGCRLVERNNRLSNGLFRRVQVSIIYILSRRLYKRSGAGPQWILALIATLGYSI